MQSGPPRVGGRGGASCPGPPTWEGPLKKRDLIKSLDFAQKRSQNAGNAISETLNSKMFSGEWPRNPLKMQSLDFNALDLNVRPLFQ